MFDRRSAGQDLAPLLANLGWAEVLAEDPAAALTALFTEHGRALANSRALDDVVLAELPASVAVGRRRAVIYPHPLDGQFSMSRNQPLRGLALGPLDGTQDAVIPTTLDGGAVALLLVRTDELTLSEDPIRGFDNALGWRTVTGPYPARADAVPAGTTWDRAVAAGRRALAAEILGVCEAALELVLAHATARVQFSRPIGSFQAVRHRLAEGYVAMAGARSVLDNAYAVMGSDGAPWAALVAKMRAGQAQAVLMRHAVQVSGAIGLTGESDIHRYVERAAALDALLGGHQALTEVIGSAVLDSQEIDAAFELL
ncbi:acyl-CoA/acyl-ACP dehydrogenase [Mycolicibacterium alvei]|nr:acyl-CoA/acyl-ACP dehydrogenase [Mycolicibacterium alvei]